MPPSILPDTSEDSELNRWADEGIRREPGHSNIVIFVSPDEQYSLTVEVDDPIHGYLIRLTELGDQEERIGQAVVDDNELALEVAAQMAAAADDLAAVHDRPSLGPEHIYEEDVEFGNVDAPDGWDGDEEWRDALEEAYEEADILRSKGTLTTKTIDEREYYYLQWREGDKVRSQYVGPVNPA
jgi:hypothetical protein